MNLMMLESFDKATNKSVLGHWECTCSVKIYRVFGPPRNDNGERV